MKIAYANTIPLRKILFKIGLKPLRKVSIILAYVSPFDTTGNHTLEVNIKTNTWFDSALNRGGDVIEFLTCYLLSNDGEGGTQADALRWLNNIFKAPPKIIADFAEDHKDTDSKYEVRAVLPVMHPALLRYLDERKIDRHYGVEYLREVRILNKQTKKAFRALALRNEDGGFAVRNPCRKANIGPIAVTFIRGQTPKPDAVHIFKDIFDYLSILASRMGRLFKDDVIILNSYHALNDAAAYIRNYGYKTAYFWLDNTPEGFASTKALVAIISLEEGLTCKRMNSLYAGYKDANEWWVAKCSRMQHQVVPPK